MDRKVHILNGDALKAQFPAEIQGTQIIFRECLVEGPVHAGDLSKLYAMRSDFLETSYPIEGLPDYEDFVVSEFNKIGKIPKGSEVNLWFEDDLFCQVNLWFCIHLLKDRGLNLYLVRPDQLSPYGFAAYSQKGLLELFSDKQLIKSSEGWDQLWESFRSGDVNALIAKARSMKAYPFIAEAVRAHRDRFPREEPWGRPERSLIEITKELKTEAFGPVFQEFTRREAIYGFGDLQVKRLLDKVVSVEKDDNHE